MVLPPHFSIDQGQSIQMLQKISIKGRTGGPEKLYSGTFQCLAILVSLVILDPNLGGKEINL
jgi:hypothetical protein